MFSQQNLVVVEITSVVKIYSVKENLCADFWEKSNGRLSVQGHPRLL